MTVYKYEIDCSAPMLATRFGCRRMHTVTESQMNAEYAIVPPCSRPSLQVKAVQRYISELLEADEKVLVFAHHRCLLDGIEACLRKARKKFIRIDGATAAHERQVRRAGSGVPRLVSGGAATRPASWTKQYQSTADPQTLHTNDAPVE